ncbi:hypothetical protein [Synechococcus sp. NB0720_010]|uniref:hypothetical protein n=1 Tax=Synechococcus sp. NB0720_010 TaxID=2907159 RepID=UPI001FF9FECB|nr:hypothetical protein [Synechococcus sp. NB0720_010]UPH90774.1 hypothetical protein LY254_03495 [Synechococcus sp. NB0720_010]
MERWRSCPALADKDEAFLAAVADSLVQLEALSPKQRHCLALFKAAELVNALIQIKERREAEDRVGPELAHRSFALVRSVIRNRSLPYAGSESECLRDPQLTAVIDEGCRLFHLGKTNKELYQQALALSAAQCLALQDQLGPALDQYLQGAGLELPETLIASVRASFIDAYRS